MIARKCNGKLELVESTKSTVCQDGTLTEESKEYYKSIS